MHAHARFQVYTSCIITGIFATSHGLYTIYDDIISILRSEALQHGIKRTLIGTAFSLHAI